MKFVYNNFEPVGPDIDILNFSDNERFSIIYFNHYVIDSRELETFFIENKPLNFNF